MQDMLVKLYELPDDRPLQEALAAENIHIRRAMAPDKHRILEVVRQISGDSAASEADVAFAYQPIRVFIATKADRVLGYACYDATMKNFFGPMAVRPEMRGKGIGKALLLAALHAMADDGYGYAIIGGVGPAEFYAKTVGATLIEGSSPGVYGNFLPLLKEDRPM